MGRLDGKVALITGGARGMGKSHVRTFVAEGASVVFGDVLDGERVSSTLENCFFVRHDVTKAQDWSAAVGTALERFGRLDILVNNAGILAHQPISEMPEEDFRRVIDVNLVVNISSIEGFTGAAGLSAYSASKFAVRGLTRTAAQELGQHGIRVNSVHPGGIMTRMAIASASSFSSVDPAAFLKSLPIPRMGEPAEVSKLVLFLASDESSYCTGAEFVADGGMLSGPGY
jgi:3alpha(or 20beta)-hydroxysteroid dehydrogenase